MKRWKKRPMADCPRCGAQETAQHVWVCRGNDADNVWESSINTLQSWLASVNTDPDLQHALFSHFQSWRDHVSGPTFTHYIYSSSSKINWQQDGIDAWKDGYQFIGPVLNNVTTIY